MTNEEFDTLYPQYADDIEAIARKLARMNDDLRDDLVQEGLITFLALDLSLVKLNQGSYVRQAVRNRMIDYLRKQRLYESQSLDHLLTTGSQVMEDEDTGEVVLVRMSALLRQRELDDWYDDSAITLNGDDPAV